MSDGVRQEGDELLKVVESLRKDGGVQKLLNLLKMLSKKDQNLLQHLIQLMLWHKI